MRTISKEELVEILDKHGKWFRGEEGGVRADLREANLMGADLREANLNEANLYVLNADFVRGINLIVISTGLKHRIVKHDTDVYIGCHKYSLQEWLEHYEEIGKKEHYSKSDINTDGKYLTFLNSLG